MLFIEEIDQIYSLSTFAPSKSEVGGVNKLKQEKTLLILISIRRLVELFCRSTFNSTLKIDLVVFELNSW